MDGGPLQLRPSVTFCTQTAGRKSRAASRSGPSNIDPEKPSATFRDVSLDRQQLMFYSELCANVTQTQRCFVPVVLEPSRTKSCFLKGSRPIDPQSRRLDGERTRDGSQRSALGQKGRFLHRCERGRKQSMGGAVASLIGRADIRQRGKLNLQLTAGIEQKSAEQTDQRSSSGGSSSDSEKLQNEQETQSDNKGPRPAPVAAPHRWKENRSLFSDYRKLLQN